MKKKIAKSWLVAVTCIVIGSVLLAVGMAIWHSDEPWFWGGLLAFSGMTLWSAVNL